MIYLSHNLLSKKPLNLCLQAIKIIIKLQENGIDVEILRESYFRVRQLMINIVDATNIYII